MENFFGIMKQEMYYGVVYYNYDELKGAIDNYIEYYNKQTIKEKCEVENPLRNKV